MLLSPRPNILSTTLRDHDQLPIPSDRHFVPLLEPDGGHTAQLSLVSATSTGRTESLYSVRCSLYNTSGPACRLLGGNVLAPSFQPSNRRVWFEGSIPSAPPVSAISNGGLIREGAGKSSHHQRMSSDQGLHALISNLAVDGMSTIHGDSHLCGVLNLLQVSLTDSCITSSSAPSTPSSPEGILCPLR